MSWHTHMELNPMPHLMLKTFDLSEASKLRLSQVLLGFITVGSLMIVGKKFQFFYFDNYGL